LDELWIFVTVAGAIVALALWQSARRERRLAHLARDGQPVTGTVLRRRILRGRSGTRYVVVFSYPAGTRMRETSAYLDAAQFEALADEGPIELVYLPQDPDTVAPAVVVESWRREGDGPAA